MSTSQSTTEASFEANDAKVHPNFNDESADIIIYSNQGTIFRMHKLTLQKTCKLLELFFEDQDTKSNSSHRLDKLSKLTGPIPGSDSMSQSAQTGNTASSSNVITLPFADQPVERVLFMLSGLPMQPWSSFAEFEAAVDVIEYLDAPGPLSLIRASCFSPVFSSEPIRLYALGARFEWEEVAQYAAELSLRLNLWSWLSSPASSGNVTSSSIDVEECESHIKDQLSLLSGASLLKLLGFHRRRRDAFRTLLFSPDVFTVGNQQDCSCRDCGMTLDNRPWYELRSRLLLEIDQNASGERILDLEMEDWEESHRCWDAACPKAGCGRLLYDRLSTLRSIRDCIKQLPRTL